MIEAGGVRMLKTTKKLVNEETIINILNDIVKKSYEEIKDEEVLLCLECSDVDLEIATANHFEFQDAIKENFELDEFGDIIDHEEYRKLMYELFDFFIELHINSSLFDYFPEGEYTVDGKVFLSDSDIVAPKGKFYAPFEHALVNHV
jgi:hypothetical protein